MKEGIMFLTMWLSGSIVQYLLAHAYVYYTEGKLRFKGFWHDLQVFVSVSLSWFGVIMYLIAFPIIGTAIRKDYHPKYRAKGGIDGQKEIPDRVPVV